MCTPPDRYQHRRREFSKKGREVPRPRPRFYLLTYRLRQNVILTYYPRYTALLVSDNGVLALDLCLDEEEMSPK